MGLRSFDARFANDRLAAAAPRRWMRRALGPALAAALVAIPLATPSRADDHSGLKARYNMGDPVAADTVAMNPQIYQGKKIFVEGYVDDVYGPRLFEIEKQPDQYDQSMVGGTRSGAGHHGHDLLIYLPASVDLGGIGKDKKILVVGTLQEGLSAPAEEIGTRKDLEHRAVIVAEAVEVK